MRLIDADELINAFDRTFLGNNPRGVIRATIENASTIEPERRKGKWTLIDGHMIPIYKCSQCNNASFGGDFCQNCGADMRGDNNGRYVYR